MIHRVRIPSRPVFRPGASGARAVLFTLGLALGVTNCTPVAMSTPDPGPPEPQIPSIEQGNLSGSMAREAQRRLVEARSALESGLLPEARDVALDVIQHYPGAPGSGEALSILAEACLGLGDAAGAVDAATRYLALMDPGSPFYSDAAVLKSRVLAETGSPGEALSTLLLIPGDAPEESVDRAIDLLRGILPELRMPQIREFAENLDPSHPIQEFLGPNLEGVMGVPLVLGAILPRTEVSPGLMEYGEWILEGIQVAIEEFKGDLRRPVELEIVDHGGESGGGARAMRQLEAMGAVGAIGPLTLEVLQEAAGARGSSFPIISPFSFLPAAEADGVLSLSGPDPGGAQYVARYAWDLGLERVVVLRPGTEEAEVEAGAFREIFQEVGGVVPREVVYDSGATFFQAQFEEVGRSLPDGLFLPLSSRDIQLLAPQFTFYGLDTLGIQLLGTSGWAEDAVVLDVDSRHTDGVIASTTRISQDETEAFQEFRARYEELFQRTLRSQVPAYGYDAAALFLRALVSDPQGGRELLEALEGVDDFPGATGRLTVDGGRVLRQPLLVRIQNHELIYISPRFD